MSLGAGTLILITQLDRVFILADHGRDTSNDLPYSCGFPYTSAMSIEQKPKLIYLLTILFASPWVDR